MIIKSFFHLDCNPIIPECAFQCPKCIDEIRVNLKTLNGIKEVSLTEKKGVSLIEVEFDSEIITVEKLLKKLENLPSFYSGFFIPEIIST